MVEPKTRVLISNRKARYEYFILETLEAGIVLSGTEVKSIRMGNANLQDSFAVLRNGEVWVEGMHISPYEQGTTNSHDPKRKRKLLLQKKEIRKLAVKGNEKGLTLVPLSVYFKGPYAKVELGVARGKKTFDKRQAIAERDAKRNLDRIRRRSQ
jgi:SsrA-binding protein